MWKKEELLKLISQTEEDPWWPGKSLAEELRLHLREEEELLGCLHTELTSLVSGLALAKGRLSALVSRQRFYLVARGLSQWGKDDMTIRIDSAPVGRIRSIRTDRYTQPGKEAVGRLWIDFAGTVLHAESGSSHYTFFYESKGWPSAEVSAFLVALYEAWR